MKLFLAGGVGEHGRNCFLVQGETMCFLVDSGKMADTPEDPYPHLTREQISSLDAVFLTHSHADHTGALPWLYENDFRGPVIASEETLRQLPFPAENAAGLQTLCPNGTGTFRGLNIAWGRSGHCAGSVWYRFTEGGKTILFSGDYTENTRAYACDPIRGQTADLAVLDCAYGRDAATYGDACRQLVRETERMLSGHGSVLFPVPKYGRGIELLTLFSEHLPGAAYSADALFLQNLAERAKDDFWYRPGRIEADIAPIGSQTRGIVFVSDPQLRTPAARETAERILSLGGAAVMTGTPEKGSFSEKLLLAGKMTMLRYPVHLNCAQYEKLIGENHFTQTVAYHSPDIPAPRKHFEF